MTFNPLFAAPRTQSLRVQQKFVFTGLTLFDQINQNQFELTQSTTDQSRHLAASLREHIKTFYRDKLHTNGLIRMNISVFGSIPDYSIQTLNRIDVKLNAIKADVHEKIDKYYSAVRSVIGIVEKALPWVLTRLNASTADVIKKVFNCLTRLINGVIAERTDGKVTDITKMFMRQIAKEKLVPLMHDPMGQMTTSSWDDDIFDDDLSFSGFLTSLGETPMIVIDMITSLVKQDEPAEPAAVEPKKKKDDEPADEQDDEPKKKDVPKRATAEIAPDGSTVMTF